MKKLLSLTLAAIFIASVLASCAGKAPAATVGSKIRLTSSDAADAAAWLEARLGDKLTDSVVLGTNADGYAVDVSALEAKYAEMLAILAKYGVTVSGTLGNEGADFSLAENMLDTARGLWNVKTAYINKYAREVIAEQFEEYDGDGALKLGGK